MKLSILTNKNGALGKTIDVDTSGKLIKTHPDPMHSGTILHRDISLSELPAGLAKLNGHRALVHGVVKGSEDTQRHIIVSVKDHNTTPINGSVSRSLDCIEYEGNHLSMLDHDPDDQCPHSYLAPSELLHLLAKIDKQWENVAHCVFQSTSSGIRLDDKSVTVDNPGYHLYFEAKCAEKLKEYMTAVFKRTVINGHGWIKLSSNGAMNIRSCFDGSVYSPERIDFTAAPTLKSERLTQDRPAPEYFPGNVIDCSVIPVVDDSRYQEIVKALKGDPEILKRSAELANRKATVISRERGIPIERAREFITSQIGGDLLVDDLIIFQKFGEVSVGDVLADLSRYDLEPCADPGEPEYGTSKAIFYANDGEKPLVHSVLHWGRNYFLPVETLDDFEWPDPLPIRAELPPVEMLTDAMIPEPFRDWVKDAANRMQMPHDFIIAPLLVVCGSIIGTSCRIRPKQRDDWTVTPNLWGGIVAPPSMLKTPALNEAVNKTLGRLEAAAREEHEDEIASYEAGIVLDAAKKKAIKLAIEKAAKLERDGKNNGKSLEALGEELKEQQPCTVPTERRYKTNDSSIEKIVELLGQNPRGLLYFRDELIGLFKRAERAGNEQDRAFLLESWNGDGSHTDDRIGRGTVRCDNLCISLLGGIQPDRIASYLHAAINDGDNDGFIQRLQLMVYPDPIQGWEYRDEWPDTEAKNRAFTVIERLAIMEPGEEGYLRFSLEGQEVFKQWLTWMETEKLVDQDEHTVMLEHLAKYRSLMPTLALIFRLLEAADTETQPGPVSERAARMAAAWCQYLESHARRIHSLALDTEQAGGARLAEKIKTGALGVEFKTRDVQMKKWAMLNKRHLAQEAIEYLIEHDWLREIAPPAIGDQGGRPPATIYQVNPKIISECTG